MKSKILISLIFVFALFLISSAPPAPKPKVIFIGDSTVRTGSGNGAGGQWGWGDKIANYFDTTRIDVINKARGGRSSRSYVTEGLWEEVFQTLNAGDFVLIQFGHNDGSALNDTLRARGSIRGTGEDYEDLQNLITKRYETVRSYGWYLRKYIREAKAKGATPIIVSPIPRKHWIDGRIAVDTATYRIWAQQTAEKEGVPFIDLNKLSADRMTAIAAQYGKTAVDSVFYGSFDFTHTLINGAKLNASLVVDAIKALNNCNLKNYLLDKAYNVETLRAMPLQTPLPEGNYDVTVTLGSPTKAAVTTVRAESRRLYLEDIKTAKGKFREETFTVNIRNKNIGFQRDVKLKPREKHKLNWDDNISFEFAGQNPAVRSIRITPDDKALTVFICGNSTVVDQDNEPYCGWGQMITRFFGAGVAFANYAESGESAASFLGAGRLAKIFTQAHAGDYVFVEFGHNDQKRRGEGIGAWTSFTAEIKYFIDESRKRGLKPVLLTPVQRRNFVDGKIVNTHEDYPDAIRQIAATENVPLIDLHKTTATLYEAMGETTSVKAFVHYPVNTFPNQKEELKDNTHFNSYGGYEIARCVIEGIKQNNLQDILKFLRPEVKPFNPAKPDDVRKFNLPASQFVEIEKPDGN
ncbi:MAG: rhamnogalacturonan acetylesterase [Paludibacter sp.]|jgi:lysophospholipase L1-like esterase|nr:rhamnogalacturonan acetylesterase [Paludibacter sp.]